MAFVAWAEQHPNWMGDAATYGAIHARLRSWLGPASERHCPCGKPAAEWAYDHRDPNERTAPNGAVYSLLAVHYVAMCRSCHRYLDADHKGQARCGTYAGYFRHRRRGESPCQSCKDAGAARARRKAAEKKRLTEYDKDPA